MLSFAMWGGQHTHGNPPQVVRVDQLSDLLALVSTVVHPHILKRSLLRAQGYSLYKKSMQFISHRLTNLNCYSKYRYIYIFYKRSSISSRYKPSTHQCAGWVLGCCAECTELSGLAECSPWGTLSGNSRSEREGLSSACQEPPQLSHLSPAQNRISVNKISNTFIW